MTDITKLVKTASELGYRLVITQSDDIDILVMTKAPGKEEKKNNGKAEE